MTILYQDPQMLAVVKPSGLLSQAGKEGEETMLTILRQETGAEVYPVHRLDRETGGVMVYARTARAAAALSQAIQQGRVKKEYLAAVYGCPEAPEGLMEDLLLHDQKKNKSYVVTRQRRGVKKARLSYALLAEKEDRSLIQVRLFTGRTHQIRVQFASRKMPLVGDGRYGGGSGKLALWSARLTLPHPESGEKMTFLRLPETLGGFSECPPLKEME